MHSAIADQSQYVVQHSELPDLIAKRYSGWHASAPVLTALAFAAIIGSILAAILHSAALGLMVSVMAVLMIGAAGFTLFSFYATGELIEVRFEKSSRVARLLFRGPVAHTARVVPISHISGVRMAMRYDNRGQKVSEPTLDLANGRRIALPQSTTWSDIEAIRAIITDDVDEVAEAWARKSSSAALAYGRARRQAPK